MMRLNDTERSQLRAMAFTHAIVLVKDVSVVLPGSVQSVFTHRNDALAELKRLNDIYSGFADEDGEAFEVVEL